MGDPRWDLVSAYESLGWNARHRRLASRPILRALCTGYRAEHGPARLDRDALVSRAALTAYQAATAPGFRRRPEVAQQYVERLRKLAEAPRHTAAWDDENAVPA
jgi:hypothetical protein